MTTMKKRTRDHPTERAMLDAVAAFLQSNGWNVATIGGRSRIEQPDPSAPFRYQFVVTFTGAKPKAAA